MFTCFSDQSSSPLNSCSHSSSTLRVYYQNVRGLRTKVDELFLAVLDPEYDVIVLTETWLNDEITSVQLFGNEYNVFRRDRDPSSTGLSRGGGVLIAVSNRLTSSPLTDLIGIDQNIEHLWVTVETGMQKIYIGVVYLSPDEASDPLIVDAHLKSAATVADSLRSNDRHILLGDYNQPLLNWIKHSANFAYPDPATSSFSIISSALLDAMDFLGNRQMNLVTNSRGRILDLVFLNEFAVDSCTVTTAMEPLIEMDLHHPPLLVALACPRFTPFQSTTDTCSLNFRRANFAQISEILFQKNWSFIESATDIDEAVHFFTSALHESFREHVPLKRPIRKPPWSDAHLRLLKRKRATAIKRFSRAKNAINKREFNIASSNYKRYNRIRYSQHIERMQRMLKHNPKRFWSFVNEKRKETGLPTEMLLGERKSTNLGQTCNLFAEHFASVFTSSQATSSKIERALRNVPSNMVNLVSIHFSEEEVKAAIAKLKLSSTVGPDGIPANILKNCIDALWMPLLVIFNLSIRTGKFPSAWKKSWMFPVHKKGNKNNVLNYRGITSLCACSKVLEILVSQRLFTAAKSYISVDQHGFFPGRSINTNLLEFTSLCIRTMEKGGQVDTVYTDLKAAFDRIDHRLLLAKLQYLGLGEGLGRWFESFLINRSLTVRLGNEESFVFQNNSGVPQGSNIGPLLFCIYFNDVTYSLPSGCRMLYADDLKIYRKIESFSDCLELQHLLSKFMVWCDLNCLTVSVEKCNVISFTRKKNPEIWNYTLQGSPLERVPVIKDLGVILDSKMTFEHHLSHVVAKANRNLGFILRTTREFTKLRCLRTLYCALVRPHLESAAVIWSPSHANWIHRIESVQSKFTRSVLRLRPWPIPEQSPSYTQRCSWLELDTLADRREYMKAAFVGKLLLGSIDAPNILERIDFNVMPRQLRSREFLRLGFHRTLYGQNEPIRAMCVVFNDKFSEFDFNMTPDMFVNRLRASMLR